MSALTVNLVAPMLLTQLLWPSLAAGGGAVVNIGSSGGIGDDAYGSPEYGAANAGIRRFTASLSSRTDLRVMAVVPGWIGLERAHHEWQRCLLNNSMRPDRSSHRGTSRARSPRCWPMATRAKSLTCCTQRRADIHRRRPETVNQPHAERRRSCGTASVSQADPY